MPRNKKDHTNSRADRVKKLTKRGSVRRDSKKKRNNRSWLAVTISVMVLLGVSFFVYLFFIKDGGNLSLSAFQRATPTPTASPAPTPSPAPTATPEPTPTATPVPTPTVDARYHGLYRYPSDDVRKEYGAQLKELANYYPELNRMVDYMEHYPTEILMLVLGNYETIDYALDYPFFFPAEVYSEPLEEEIVRGEIPLFIQWDKRWGYYDYGGKPLAINGCGPTSLSMVVAGLTGDATITPDVIAKYSQRKRHYEEGVGTKWTLMMRGCKYFGVEAEEMPLEKKMILRALQRNKPIIVSMNRGYFTRDRHYIVLTGVTEDGMVIIHDPNSIRRSEVTWDLDAIMNQMNNLWVFKRK